MNNRTLIDVSEGHAETGINPCLSVWSRPKIDRVPIEPNSSRSPDLEAILADIAAPTKLPSEVSAASASQTTPASTSVAPVKSPAFSLSDAAKKVGTAATSLGVSVAKLLAKQGPIGQALGKLPSASQVIEQVAGPLRKVWGNISSQEFRSNKVVVLSAGAILVGGLMIFGFVKFEFVTVTEGVTTSNGPSEGQRFFIEKTGSAERNDLVVGLMPGSEEGENEKLVMGTVFSKNDETFAVLGDNVVWHLPVGYPRAKVWFTSPLR